MQTDTFLSWMTSLLVAHAGTFIVFALAPIVGCLVLDGLVLVMRRRGFKALAIAVLFFLAAIVLGLFVKESGLNGMAGSPSFNQDVIALERNGNLYLTFAVPLGLLAAVIRIVGSLGSRK